MKFWNFLALPALATAAVMVERQAAADVQIVTAKSLSPGQGSGCPSSGFGLSWSSDNRILTLHFDNYHTDLYPANRSDVREKQCKYEVTLRFPEGCTKGTVLVMPRGVLQLSHRFEAKFSSTYTLSPSTGGVTSSPGEIVYRSDNYGAPEGSWFDWVKEHPVGVQARVQAGGQRDYTFTAESRMLLVAPSIDPNEFGAFHTDSLDIAVQDMVTC